MFDQYKIPSYFPSALNDPGQGSLWNGLDGPQASDYAGLMDGIKLCKTLVPTIESVSLVGLSQGGATAIGATLLYPDQVSTLLVISGLNNQKIADYVKTLSGSLPVLFEKPIPAVFMSSPHDEYGTFQEMKTASGMFAALNGFTGTAVTNAVQRDYIKAPAGNDSTVVEMGSHTRFIMHTAKNHYDSTFLSDNGFEVLVNRYLNGRLLPGDE